MLPQRGYPLCFGLNACICLALGGTSYAARKRLQHTAIELGFAREHQGLDSKVQTTRSVPLPCGHEAAA